MRSPYEGLPEQCFWRTGVSGQVPGPLPRLYVKKYPLGPRTAIGTAGSCFAQHLTRNLRLNQMNIVDVEPKPRDLPDELAQAYGYSLYSARYGNVYTIRQLLELVRESLHGESRQDIVWEKDGRFYDALRPSIEPDGLLSPEEVLASRAYHLERVADLFRSIEVLVFTFGLTEAWVDTKTGLTLPTAPGTIAGTFDPDRYVLKVYGHREVYDDFLAVRAILKAVNPDIRFLVTVSPVPLTATATGAHVLSATTYSKATLRSAAGQLQEELDDVDYFPSYDLITAGFTRGQFFAENMRSVTAEGVSAAMAMFFSEHAPGGAAAQASWQTPAAARPKPAAEAPAPSPKPVGLGSPSGRADGIVKEDQVLCDEELLEAFSR